MARDGQARLLTQDYNFIMMEFTHEPFRFYASKLIEIAGVYTSCRRKWNGTDEEFERMKALAEALAKLTPDSLLEWPTSDDAAEWQCVLFELNVILQIFRIAKYYDILDVKYTDESAFFLRSLRSSPHLRSIYLRNEFSACQDREEYIQELSRLASLRKLSLYFSHPI